MIMIICNNYRRSYGFPEQRPGQLVRIIAIGQVRLRYGRDHVVRYGHTAAVGLDHRGHSGARHGICRDRRPVADGHGRCNGRGRVGHRRRRGRRGGGDHGRGRHRVGGRHGLRLRLELFTRSLRHSPVPDGCKQRQTLSE